jgi:hypothetical protein
VARKVSLNVCRSECVVLRKHPNLIKERQRHHISALQRHEPTTMSLPQPVPPSWKVCESSSEPACGQGAVLRHGDASRISASPPVTCCRRTSLLAPSTSKSRPRHPQMSRSRSRAKTTKKPRLSTVTLRQSTPISLMASFSPRPGLPPTWSALPSKRRTTLQRVSSST